MNKPLLLIIILLQFTGCCYAIDPVSDYNKNRPSDLTGPFVLYRWTANISDKVSVMFLTDKSSYREARHDGTIPFWSPYIKRDGDGYISSTGLDVGNDFSLANDVGIDPDRIYIGPITQLGGKRGIVTIQIDQGRKDNPSMAYIHAYTVEGDHLKHTILATYNYDTDQKNAIYDEYLSESKRTKVQLQEVTP